MKRFMKFCLLLAAALGVIGVAGIGIGMAMGARPAQFLNLAHYDGSIFWWMKNGNERLEERVESWSDNVEDNVEQWSEDLEDDLDDWSSGWGHHWEDDWEQGGAHHGWDGVAAGQLAVPSGDDIDSFEDSFVAGKVKQIKMDLHYTILHITSGEENSDILVKGRNARSYFTSLLDGDTLYLEDTRTHAQCQKDQALELEVVLPARQLQEVELDLGASDASVDQLLADRISIDVGAGMLTAGRLAADELELDCGVGSGTVERLEAARAAELDVGTGEITVSQFTGGSMNLGCGVGTLTVTALGNETDYNYTVDCGIGTVRLGDRSYSGLDRSASVDNGADKTVAADCGIGMISLDFAQE